MISAELWHSLLAPAMGLDSRPGLCPPLQTGPWRLLHFVLKTRSSISDFSSQLQTPAKQATSFATKPSIRLGVQERREGAGGSQTQTHARPDNETGLVCICGDGAQILARGGLEVFINDVPAFGAGPDELEVQRLEIPGGIMIDDNQEFPCPSPCSLIVALPGNTDPFRVSCSDLDNGNVGSDTTVVIQGDNECDCIVGTPVGDRIYGANGDDVIVGQEGRDILYGVGLQSFFF